MDSPMQWDACLVATAQMVAEVVSQQGLTCLSQPTLLALCQVAVQPETAALWLQTMLEHSSTTNIKGKCLC